MENLTVVIITRNRPTSIFRLLEFYKRLEANFKFILLDSSDNCNQINFIGDGFPLQVAYKKFPIDTLPWKKISDGTLDIETEFTVLSADDDFLIPSGLIEAVSFLERNREYVSAHGRYFQHHMAMSRKGKKKIDLIPLYLSGGSNEGVNPVDRLRSYLEGSAVYYPLFAVHRTKDFKFIWSSAKTYVSDWGFSEIYPCSLSVMLGKSKVLNTFYASREPNLQVWYDRERFFEMYSPIKVEQAFKGLIEGLAISGYSVGLHTENKISSLLRTFVASAEKNLGTILLPSQHSSIVSRLRWFRVRLISYLRRKINPRLTYLRVIDAAFAELRMGKVDNKFLRVAVLESQTLKKLTLQLNVASEMFSSRAHR